MLDAGCSPAAAAGPGHGSFRLQPGVHQWTQRSDDLPTVTGSVRVKPLFEREARSRRRAAAARRRQQPRPGALTGSLTRRRGPGAGHTGELGSGAASQAPPARAAVHWPRAWQTLPLPGRRPGGYPVTSLPMAVHWHWHSPSYSWHRRGGPGDSEARPGLSDRNRQGLGPGPPRVLACTPPPRGPPARADLVSQIKCCPVVLKQS